MKSYVYEHWRPDKDVCFYVGKGSGNRAKFLSRKKNKHHWGIVQKLSGLGMCVEVRMVADGLSEIDAYALEEKRIAFWLAAGVRLANKAKGGRGGMSGVKRSLETRKKHSATAKMKGPSDAQKAANALLIKMNRSPEGRERTRQLHLGRKRPPETGIKIGARHKELWADPEYKARIMTAMDEGRPENISEETLAKMRAAKTPEIRAALSAIVKAKWEEPGERERRSAAMSISNTGRVVSEAARESGRKAMTPERSVAMVKATKEMIDDPVRGKAWREALAAGRPEKLSPSHCESLKRSWTPERKRRVSQKMKAFWVAKREMADA
jgi:hypothetical protein